MMMIIVIAIIMMIIVMMIAIRIAIMITGHIYDIDFDELYYLLESLLRVRGSCSS